jgi:hypothetical protein
MSISKKYRSMMAQLDQFGFIVAIDRVARNKFTFLVNGTAEKSYRTRSSCNRQLEKLYKKNTNNQIL